MKVCTNCGALYDDQLNACPGCGTPSTGKHSRKKGHAALFGTVAALFVVVAAVVGIFAMQHFLPANKVHRAANKTTDALTTLFSGFEKLQDANDAANAYLEQGAFDIGLHCEEAYEAWDEQILADYLVHYDKENRKASLNCSYDDGYTAMDAFSMSVDGTQCRFQIPSLTDKILQFDTLDISGQIRNSALVSYTGLDVSELPENISFDIFDWEVNTQEEKSELVQELLQALYDSQYAAAGKETLGENGEECDVYVIYVDKEILYDFVDLYEDSLYEAFEIYETLEEYGFDTTDVMDQLHEVYDPILEDAREAIATDWTLHALVNGDGYLAGLTLITEEGQQVGVRLLGEENIWNWIQLFTAEEGKEKTYDLYLYREAETITVEIADVVITLDANGTFGVQAEGLRASMALNDDGTIIASLEMSDDSPYGADVAMTYYIAPLSEAPTILEGTTFDIFTEDKSAFESFCMEIFFALYGDFDSEIFY